MAIVKKVVAAGWILLAAQAVTVVVAQGAGPAAPTAPTTAPTSIPATAPAEAVKLREEDEAALHETMSKMLRVGQSVFLYANARGGKYPANLGETTRYGLSDERDGKRFRLTTALKAAQYISPRDLAAPAVPENPTPEWVTEHSSFVYLGSPALTVPKLAKLPEGQWGAIAILHEKFEHAGDSGVVAVGFLDGHIDALPLAEAKRVVDESKARLAQVAAAAGNNAATRPK